MASCPLREGAILRGKYRVTRVLGTGGMGVVVLARHTRLDQNVAIKMLSDDAASKPGAVARFAREARAAARIRSDHVVRVLDVDESETGAPFIVMEYLEGRDLETALREDGPLSVERAVDVVLQACLGLAEAHALGIVHRDLKPANLLLATRPGASGVVKILDFGISKATREGAAGGAGGDQALGVTQGGRAVGSPSYMSPEQLKSSRDVDARTDVWSLGVTLHQLLSGTLPFDADDATALGARIATEPPVPLRSVCPDAPAALQAAVARCLDKDPERRFDTVAALAVALAPLTPGGAEAAERVSSILFAARHSSGKQLASERTSSEDEPGTVSISAMIAAPESTPSPSPGLSTPPTATVDEPVAISHEGRAPVLRRSEPGRRAAAGAGVAAMALVLAGVVGVGAWLVSKPSTPSSSARGRPVPIGASTSSSGAIRVRVLYDMTGSTRDVGSATGKGIYDRLREIDASGGIRGRRLDIDVQDSKYDTQATIAVYDAWRGRPEWPEVSAIFVQGTPMTQVLAPRAAEEQKLVVTSAYAAELGSPVPVSHDIAVPSLNDAFVEATVPLTKKSPGYPFVFFQATDYTTSARIAMRHAWLRGAKRVGFFYCSTSAFCADPVDGAKTFLARLGGTRIGRDSNVELTDTDAQIDAKVRAYFTKELAQHRADPKYDVVDWIWFGNTRASLALLGKALARITSELGLTVSVITNTYALDEDLLAICGAPCVGFFGVQAFPAWGDPSVAAMGDVMRVHAKYRAIDKEDAGAYRTVGYVAGYATAATWKIAAEGVVEAGLPVTGTNLRAAYERFRAQPVEGFATLTYSEGDHRPRGTARVYRVAPAGGLEAVGQPLTIQLLPEWLGW